MFCKSQNLILYALYETSWHLALLDGTAAFSIGHNQPPPFQTFAFVFCAAQYLYQNVVYGCVVTFEPVTYVNPDMLPFNVLWHQVQAHGNMGRFIQQYPQARNVRLTSSLTFCAQQQAM